MQDALTAATSPKRLPVSNSTQAAWKSQTMRAAQHSFVKHAQLACMPLAVALLLSAAGSHAQSSGESPASAAASDGGRLRDLACQQPVVTCTCLTLQLVKPTLFSAVYPVRTAMMTPSLCV